MQFRQLSVSADPLPTYSKHVVSPPNSGIHSIDFAELDDVIHMLC